MRYPVTCSHSAIKTTGFLSKDDSAFEVRPRKTGFERGAALGDGIVSRLPPT
jgi:hypothetical protein